MANDINSSILFAIRKGNLRRVKHLVDQYGLNYSPEWSEGYCLLYDAIERRRKEIAKFLLSEGAKISCKNSSRGSDSKTLLHLAVEKCDPELVGILLDRSADIEAKNKEGQTPLRVATEGGNEELVSLLLSRGARVDSVDNFEATSLHCACQTGNVSIVELLLKHGAYVNKSRSSDRYQPLHISSERGFEDITRSLLNFGADRNPLAEGKLTPLHLAVTKGFSNIVDLLLLNSANVNVTNEDEKTPLQIAVEKQSLLLVSCILRHRPDVNDRFNRSALRTALKREGEENYRIFEILRLYGFNFSLEDINDPELLYSAACKGDSKTVEFLLNNGANPNITVHNSTLLNIVASLGKESIAKLLLDAGCPLDIADVSGNMPIDCCVRSKDHNCIEMLRLLFAYGARMTDDNRLLHDVIKKGCPELLKILINNGACVGKCKGLLHEAVKRRCFDICKILVESSINVNEFDESGKSALMYTAIKEIEFYEYPLFQNDECNGEMRGKIAQLLLKNGADVNATTKLGQSTLHFAASNGFVEVFEVLLAHKADINAVDRNDRTPLHAAADGGHMKLTEILLKSGANVNITDDHSQSPLHLAVLGGKQSEKIFDILFKYNAAVNCVDKYMKTPLHLAIEKNQKNVVEVLLKHGARVNFIESDGLTQLHFASQSHCDIGIISLLLKYGSDINATVKNNVTSLHLATLTGSREIVKLLLENGANVDAIRGDGASPLHIAAFIKYPEKAQLLLKFDADINLQDATGKTALHLAAYQRDYSIIQCLLHNGADVNITCNRGMIPLDLVELDYNLETLESLGLFNYQSKTDYDFIFYENVMKFEARSSFEYHLVKLNVAGFHLCKKNQDLMESVDDYLEYYQLKCKDEIERIKELNLSPKITVHDVLIGKAGFLYTRNDVIMEALKSIDCEARFPRYCLLIERSVRNDKRKNELVSSSEVWFDVLIRTSNALNTNKLPILPSELREAVLSYLNIKDLRMFILCGQDLERQVKKS